MLYLDLAGRDLKRNDEFIRQALYWHNRALSLITDESAQQEESVGARFAKRAREAGIDGLSGESALGGEQLREVVSHGKRIRTPQQPSLMSPRRGSQLSLS